MTERKCPKCSSRWPHPCEQTICIEMYQECMVCRFSIGGAGTQDELLEISMAASGNPVPAPWEGEKSVSEQTCWCRHCETARNANLPQDEPTFPRILFCPDCGNKRCPKATCHGHQCSGHNSPGQAGSEYGTETCAADHARPINWQAHAEALAEALRNAARSLRTISKQAGIDEFMSEMDEVRGYAQSRAWCAEKALAAFDQDRGSK